MLSYCPMCKKNKKKTKKNKQTKSIDPVVLRTRNDRAMILSRGAKTSKFVKKQEAKGLLSNLGIQAPLRKLPILEDVLF